MALLVSGCASRPLPPPDTSQPGWRLHEGQAIWHPRPRSPEIAGEVLLLASADEEFLVHFTKTPLTLVAAHRAVAGWHMEIPPEGRVWRGRGRPTHRLLWLFLHDALREAPLPPQLEFTRGNDGWRLINRRTGERLEGYLQSQ